MMSSLQTYTMFYKIRSTGSQSENRDKMLREKCEEIQAKTVGI
jgi:hypothetical protein